MPEHRRRRLTRLVEKRLEPDEVLREKPLGPPPRGLWEAAQLTTGRGVSGAHDWIDAGWGPAPERRLPYIIGEQQARTELLDDVIEVSGGPRSAVLVLHQGQEHEKTLAHHPISGDAGGQQARQAQPSDPHAARRRRIAVGLEHIRRTCAIPGSHRADESRRPPDAAELVPPVHRQIAPAPGVAVA